MNRDKKLLFLIADEYPTHRPDVTVLFGKELPRHGISCDLVAQWGRSRGAGNADWPAGRALVCERTGNRIRDQVTAFWHDCRCLWSASKGEYDAVQVRDKVFAGMVGLMRARRLRVPFFFWMSFPMSEGFIAIARRERLSLGFVRWVFMSIKGQLGRWLIYRHLLPRCDHIFVQSERMASDLCQRGVQRDRMTAVPMGVDLGDVSDAEPPPAEAVSASSGGGPVIGYLGALDRARGLDFLLEVLVQVTKRFPNATLLFVGDAHEEADRLWLKARARELGVERSVTWTGWVPRDVAWNHMRRADVAVSLVPRGELFDCSSPTKVVEYLALGLPVVANDLPDQHQVLTESGAGISVPSEVPAFADAIVRILEDQAMSATMRAAGPPYVRAKRSYGVLAERVASVYRRMLHSP